MSLHSPSLRAGWLLIALISTAGCESVLGIEEGFIVGDGGSCTGASCAPCPEADPNCDAVAGGGASGNRPSGGGEGGEDDPTGQSGTNGGAGEDGAGEGGAGGPSVVCEEGELRCEGYAQVKRSRCTGNEWRDTDDCENGELCDNETGECEAVVPGCSGRAQGESTCIGRERIQCGQDLVTAERETCPTIAHCTESTDGKCLPCVDEEYSCDGDVLRVCNENRTGWDEVRTCNSGECNEDLGMCTALLCMPDRYSCSRTTNTLRSCNADGSAFVEQTPCGDRICDAEGGECDLCAPVETVCLDARRISQCDPEGQNQTESTCEEVSGGASNVCSDVLGGCVECLTPSTSCIDAAAQQTCNDEGRWGPAEPCVDQTCSGTACTGECAPDALPRCAEAGGTELCGPQGTWIEKDAAEDCPACMGDGVCVDCLDSQTKCEGASSQRTCANNLWDVPIACVNQTCVGDKCTGQCAPGQTKCESDGAYGCNASGMWERTQACSMCIVEATGARCVACELDEYTCMGDDLHRCKADRSDFELHDECGSGLCTEGQDHCDNQVCSPRSVTCVSGNRLSLCNTTGSAYTSQTTCSAPTAICDAFGNNGMGQCDRCNPNDPPGCNPGNVRTQCSNDGQNLNTTQCSGNYPICLDGACVACTPDDTKCEGNAAMRTCQDDGSWGAAAACGNATCVGKACTGVCAAGRRRCQTGPVRSQVCVDGAWVNTGDSPCDICTGEGVCLDQICTPDDIDCSGMTLRECNSLGTAYENTEVCDEGPAPRCDDPNNECDICTPGGRCLADNLTRMLCNSTGQTETMSVCPNYCLNGGCVDCRPTANRCESDRRYRRTCTGAGAWPTSGGVDCFATSKTCLTSTNDCGGSCAYGTPSCSSNQPMLCDDTGTPRAQGNPCAVPASICSGGACVDNPIYTVGRDGTGSSAWVTDPAWLYATRVTSTAAAAVVNSFGVRGTVAGGGVKLALYSNVNNLPGARLAYTNDQLGVTTSTTLASPAAPGYTLAANTIYWVVAMTSSTPSSLHRFVAPSGVNMIAAPAGVSFGNPPPSSFPVDSVEAVTVGMTELSLFLRVRNTPPP